MKVHEVIVAEEMRYETDPRRGVVARKEQVLKEGSTTLIAGGEHGEFEIESDGSFDLPDELAEHFLAQPNWFPGPNPFAVTPEPAKAKNGKS